MQTERKAKYKSKIRVEISISEPAESILVLDIGEREYVAFRAGTSADVEIRTDALINLVRDLSRRKETFGFLLGHTHDSGVLFERYAPATMPLERTPGSIDFRMKDYVRELRGFRRQGFDAQAEFHSHPYEDDCKVQIKRALRGLSVPVLLKHGLFGALEEKGALSACDKREVKRRYHALKEKGVEYARSFTGVLSTFRAKRIDAAVKLLILHRFGSLTNPVSIEIRETASQALT